MTTAADEISTLSVRVRDPEQTAITEVEWLAILSTAQALWNNATMRVMATTTVTLEPYCPIYAINSLIPDCVRILSVHDGTANELNACAYTALRATNPAWLRDVATDPVEWCMLGRDLLVIYPAVETAHTLTITYVRHLPPMAAVTDTLTLPDHDLPGFRDFAEAIAAIKLRQLKLLEAIGTRLKERLG